MLTITNQPNRLTSGGTFGTLSLTVEGVGVLRRRRSPSFLFARPFFKKVPECRGIRPLQIEEIGEAYRTARLEMLRDDIAPRGVSGFRNALHYRMRSTL
jgi:hypothetical protein